VVVNDRWGDGTGCRHGGFFSCADRYNPGTLQRHKWENCVRPFQFFTLPLLHGITTVWGVLARSSFRTLWCSKHNVFRLILRFDGNER